MNGKASKVGHIRTTLPVYEVLLSVGVELRITAEDLFNSSDDIAPADFFRALNTISTLSDVLGAVLTQHEPRLKVLEVKLPDGLSAMTVPNPLFESDAKEPPRGSGDSLDDFGGQYPF